MYSVVWVTVGLLPLWHDLKIHIIYIAAEWYSTCNCPRQFGFGTCWKQRDGPVLYQSAISKRRLDKPAPK